MKTIKLASKTDLLLFFVKIKKQPWLPSLRGKQTHYEVFLIKRFVQAYLFRNQGQSSIKNQGLKPTYFIFQ